MQNKFKRVSSECHLRRWEQQSNENHIEKLSYISKFSIINLLYVELEFMVHDITLKRCFYRLKKKWAI